jgi:hypothetical protein
MINLPINLIQLKMKKASTTSKKSAGKTNDFVEMVLFVKASSAFSDEQRTVQKEGENKGKALYWYEILPGQNEIAVEAFKAYKGMENTMRFSTMYRYRSASIGDVQLQTELGTDGKVRWVENKDAIAFAEQDPDFHREMKHQAFMEIKAAMKAKRDAAQAYLVANKPVAKKPVVKKVAKKEGLEDPFQQGETN